MLYTVDIVCVSARAYPLKPLLFEVWPLAVLAKHAEQLRAAHSRRRKVCGLGYPDRCQEEEKHRIASRNRKVFDLGCQILIAYEIY